MHRIITLLVSVILLIGMIGGPAAALTAGTLSSSTQPSVALAAEQAGNETNESAIQPGEQLRGVIGVTAAELDGEMQIRTYGVKIARAASNDSKADIVSDQLGDIDGKLTELQTEKRRLQAARDNDTISEGEYRAEMAELAAETETVKELANETNRTSQQLPRDLLEEKGINVDAIHTLKNSAEELTGPEVAVIARSIAGPDVGTSVADEQAPVNVSVPDDAGPPKNAGLSGEDDTTGPSDDTADTDDEDDRGGDATTTSTEDAADDTTPTATPDGDGSDGSGTDEAEESDGSSGQDQDGNDGSSGQGQDGNNRN